MKVKNVLIVFVASVFGGLVSIIGYNSFFKSNNNSLIKESNYQPKTQLVNLSSGSNTNLDFTFAAEKSINAVVHITTQFTQEYRTNSILDFFYGTPTKRYSKEVPLSSGSGVIVSNDGYIVTNNHVIDNSDKIQVVLNDKRTYTAKLVGTDKSTDLALLKIDEKDLPFLTYGNADDIKVGEWILAVGNPFNLNSTVTAGIVSAKARNINILAPNYAIESFIQTDAAVNPGNSGGALVNTKGQLIGINTAIASKTGAFIGYSFAVPVSIVQKIVSDLIEFNEVQRAYLNINIVNIDANISEKLNLDKIEGIYIANAFKDGAAYASGIEDGDILLKINDVSINKVPELQEQVSKYRPGDTIKITVKRDDDIKDIDVVLFNKFGNTDIVKTKDIVFFGAKLGVVPSSVKRYLNLNYGVQVTDVGNKELYKKGVKNSFIITAINKIPVFEPSDILTILQNAKGNILVSGVYPNGISTYYILYPQKK